MGMVYYYHFCYFSLSPASKECMFYGRDPIRRSSIFEIGPEDLTELVRKAFCLTHRRHDYYLREYLGKLVMNDPAKVVLMDLMHNSAITLFLC